jgi:predicted nucleic acid-binding protein
VKFERGSKNSLIQNENPCLLVRFSGRILPIDLDVMLIWGKLTGVLELTGGKMGAMDSLIAAIALHGNLTLVTRNEGDFRHAGVKIVNPWKTRSV